MELFRPAPPRTYRRTNARSPPTPFIDFPYARKQGRVVMLLGIFILALPLAFLTANLLRTNSPGTAAIVLLLSGLPGFGLLFIDLILVGGIILIQAGVCLLWLMVACLFEVSGRTAGVGVWA